MAKNIGRYLSPSSLSSFKECPRCGWLKFKAKVDRPRGIFPSLPGGMDLRLKEYFDAYRSRGTMPASIRGKVKGELFGDQAQLDAWRNWRTGPQYVDPAGRFTLGGALDELIVEEDMHDNLTVTPTDYKTRGSAPTGLADSERYYQLQLDIYALNLEAVGFKTSGHAYLLYFFPTDVKDSDIGTHGVGTQFKAEVYELKTDPARALAFVEKALAYIAQDTPPEPGPECEYCKYVALRGGH